MASNTKITEIIDEKAFEQWEKFVDSLVDGQDKMAKLVELTGGLSKSLSSTSSFKEMNAGVQNLSNTLDKLAKTQESVVQAEKKVEQSQKRLIKETEKRAKELEKEKQKQDEASKSLEDFKANLDKTSNASKTSAKSFLEMSESSEKAIIRAAELKKEIKDLSKGFRENADSLTVQEMAEYEAEMALLKDELREANKEVRNFAKEANANSDTVKASLTPYQQFSLEVKQAKDVAKDLGAELIALKNSGNGTEAEIKDLEERFFKANAEASRLDKEIKALDEGMGDHQRNVGNYKSAFDDALGSINLMGVNLGALSNSMGQHLAVGTSLLNTIKKHTAAEQARAGATAGATAATNASSKALEVLKMKLIATGIGAMVVVVGTLAAGFLSTQRGIDALTRALEPLTAIMEGLWGVVQDLGTGMVDAFKNPVESLKNLGKAIVDNVINRFKAVSVILEGIANRDFKQIADGVAQATTGVENMTDKIKDAVEWTKEQARVGAEIAEQKIKISKLQTEINRKTSENNLRMEELMEISKDTSLSYVERAKASEEIKKISEEQVALEMRIVDEKNKQLELEQSLNDTQREGAGGEEELDKLIAERNAIQQKAQTRINQQLRVTAGLKKEQAAEAKKIVDEERKRVEAIQEINRTEIEQINFVLAQRLKELKLNKDATKLTKEELEARAKLEREATEKIEKLNEGAQKKREQLAEKRLEAEKRALDREVSGHLKIAQSENASYSERLEGLQDFLHDRQRAIDLDQEIELNKLNAQREEAKKLLQEGKIEEYEALKEIIEIGEKEIADLTNEKRKELAEQATAESFKITQDRLKEEQELTLLFLEDGHQKLTELLVQQRAEGLISEEEFLEQRKKNLKDFEDAALQLEINQIEKIIDAAKKKGQNVGALEKQLAKLKIEQSKKATEAQLEDLKAIEEEEKRVKEKVKEMAKESAQMFLDLGKELLQKRVEEFEAEREMNEVQKQMELEKVENSTLNEEQKAAQKLAIDSKYAALDEQLEKKKIEAQRKVARMEKAEALAKIIWSTSQAIMSAVAAFPITGGMPWAGIIAGLGAVNAAKVLATKIPGYFTGTDSSKEGFAKVGEKGAELMVTPQGDMMLTPPSETITYLQRGTKIFNALETKRMLSENGGKGTAEIAMIEMASVVAEQRRSTAELKKTFKDYSSRVNITKEGLRVVHGRNARLKSYLKRNGIRWMN